MAGTAGSSYARCTVRTVNQLPAVNRTKGRHCSAVQAHSDDIPLMAAGTVAKLIDEGYTGYLVRATNDDMGDAVGLGTPGTIGENVLGNSRDNAEIARVLGCKDHFDLNYNNHRMADVLVK